MTPRDARIWGWTRWIMPLFLLVAMARVGLAAGPDLARQAIEDCRVQGGVIVHLGCGDGHSQNNFLRGACRLGFMPANGLVYFPPDQCFCQPGAKVLGLKAVGPAPARPPQPVPDASRLIRGPAYEASLAAKPSSSAASAVGDWPTFRHDPARHGSTPSAVGIPLADRWKATIGGPLTAPVAAQGKVHVAARDAQTLYALDLATGRTLWTFVAGGRIDSPPTIHDGRVLFGSADGWIYCLRSDDGSLCWRFLAALCDRRIACFDRIESVWPVHGSVLVRDGIAYLAAGRSTYLDGGIALWALDPASGRILHKTTLSGPFPDGGKTVPRDVSFFIRGANSDVLVSEGDAIYMRQKRLTLDLREQWPELLSNKGECDVGLHVFSTSGLLDGSWYNRTFWMYAKRWPGFQLANQAPKSGQILVVDAENTYAVHPFYRRNVHSPMFFPGREGYLLFADRNHNELNSGVQIRSKLRGDLYGGRVYGPQVEIESGPGQSGFIYGEAAGGWQSPEPLSKDKATSEHNHFNNGQWNHYRVRAVGRHIETWINGHKIADLMYDEKRYADNPEGFIGLQVHGVGKRGPFSVRWKNIYVKRLNDAK